MASVAVSQTTEVFISGRLLDARTGSPIAGGRVSCSEDSTSTRAEAVSDNEGFYSLPLVPPGFYSIRATAANYQSQEAQDMELTVAGRLELNFLLRPLSDVWEAGLYRSVFLPGARTVVTFYGPDVDVSAIQAILKDCVESRERWNPLFPMSSIQWSSTISRWRAAIRMPCYSRCPQLPPTVASQAAWACRLTASGLRLQTIC